MSRSSAMPMHGNPLFDRLPEYRALLEEQWRQQVADIIESSYAALGPAPHDSDDDRWAANTLQATTHLTAARQQLQETEAALGRVEDGSYGLCCSCGEPVLPERLEIMPATRYCVGCQKGSTS
jgi:DnaK suppressor protein